ncbi:hypothetical protein [Haloglomus litoreum]|uniref:hypothetical protein n=1 Tax=Haloglomus litoreum TaxID=3034026 RepID=UPI0023E88ABF|nr:hypothetical protein [Haloglomus sp. DT116]
MGDISGGVRLKEPKELSPDSSASIVLEYVNRDDQAFHHITNVSVWPTWDPDREIASGGDRSVPSNASKQLLATDVDTPLGLAGRQGFHVEFEVGIPSETGEMAYQHRHTDTPLVVPVGGTPRYDAVLCTAGAGDPARPVRDFIQNWGFDIYLASGEQEARERFTEFTETPTCFVGVVPADRTSRGRQAVSSTASVALSRDVPALVLLEEDATRPHLPESEGCLVIRTDLGSERALARSSGPELLGVRRSLEVGTAARLLEQVRARAKREPKEALRAVVYSVLLERTGAVETVLDSLGDPTDLFVTLAAGTAAGSDTSTVPPSRGTDRTLDPASEYDVPGAEFTLIPFDVLNKRFLEFSTDQHGNQVRVVSDDPPTTHTSVDLYRAIDDWIGSRNSIPTLNVDRIELIWSPDGEEPVFIPASAETISKDVARDVGTWFDESYRSIHTDHNITQLDVTLPAKGAYHVLTWSEEGAGALKIRFERGEPVVGPENGNRSGSSHPFLEDDWWSGRKRLIVPTPEPYETDDLELSWAR